MAHLSKGSVIVACVVTLCGLGQGRALAAEAECQSNSTQVKALSSGPQHTAVNFNTDVNGVPESPRVTSIRLRSWRRQSTWTEAEAGCHASSRISASRSRLSTTT